VKVDIHCVPKKLDHQTHGGNFDKSFKTNSQNSFIVRLSDKFAVKW